MKGDECAYRDFAMDTASDLVSAVSVSGQVKGAPQQPEVASDGDASVVGQVWDQEAAMQADPEAYRHYFDFYLKYYTQKFTRGTGSGAVGPPPPLQQHGDQPIANPHSGSALETCVVPDDGNGDSVLPLPEFDKTCRPPELSPFAAAEKMKKPWPHPPNVADSVGANSHGGDGIPRPPTSAPREPGPKARFNYVPRRNAALEQALAVKNKLNEARAQQMREEFRRNALVAYDCSDSE
jgi:hypothetical protein